GMGSWAWVGAGAWRSAGGSDTSRRVGRGGTMVAARPSGRGAHRRVAPHHRPAVPLAEHPELGELRLVHAVVPIGQVEHGVVEPLLLVLGSGFQDAASQDVGEQLVAGLLEQGGGGHSTGFRTLLGHARRAPVSSGSGGVGARRRGRPAADDLAPQCNKRRESAQRADHGRPGGYYHQRGAGVVSGSRRGGEGEPEGGAHVREEGSGGMNRFYVLLVAVALIGGGMLWYGSRREAAPAPNAPVPSATADGFRGYTLGADTAKVDVTEYSDFECPFCASFATVQMPVIRQQLIAPGKVRWRYRDFPLPSHQYSRYAALAAQCAGEQGKFWEMHDQLFTNHQWAQTGKNPSGLFRDFARTIGVDVDKYDACVSSQ